MTKQEKENQNVLCWFVTGSFLLGLFSTAAGSVCGAVFFGFVLLASVTGLALGDIERTIRAKEAENENGI
jgi:hypothetical protein